MTPVIPARCRRRIIGGSTALPRLGCGGEVGIVAGSEEVGGSWDHAVDGADVGSGAGALTAAIVAHDAGANVLVLEKSDR
jgi:hypothetical protein